MGPRSIVRNISTLCSSLALNAEGLLTRDYPVQPESHSLHVIYGPGPGPGLYRAVESTPELEGAK